MTMDEVERSDNANDDCPECPLCMEPLDLDDINFYPCTCGYQVCKFCWHRMRTDENGLCPACRQKYPDDPVEFRPIATEAMQRFKSKKQQQQRGVTHKRKDGSGSSGKDKTADRIIDSRKHLATIRVVQKNLVFVIGLPGKLTDPEVLKRPEYFGKFGRILKVMVNVLNANGTPASSASAYITYVRADDALRAIKALNNFHIEGRVLKASLGTTKYCVNFLKNMPCAKPECMYLHDLGDGAASFTKEEMQQGKHQEYEKQLLDAISSASTAPTASANVHNAPPMVTVEAPTAAALNKTSTGSCEDVVLAVERQQQQQQRRASTMPVPLQRDSSPSSSSSASLSSSSGSLKSQCESQSVSETHSERNSPSVAFDLFVDTFDEFGFDPWNESSKGLADLMELESRSRGMSASSAAAGHHGAFSSVPFAASHGMGYAQMGQAYPLSSAYGNGQHPMELNHSAAFGQQQQQVVTYEQQQQAMYMQQQQQQYRQRMMQLNRMEQAEMGDNVGYGYSKWQTDSGMMGAGYQRAGQMPRAVYNDAGYNNSNGPAHSPQQSATFYNRTAAASSSQGAFPNYRLTVQ